MENKFITLKNKVIYEIRNSIDEHLGGPHNSGTSLRYFLIACSLDKTKYINYFGNAYFQATSSLIIFFKVEVYSVHWTEHEFEFPGHMCYAAPGIVGLEFSELQTDDSRCLPDMVSVKTMTMTGPPESDHRSVDQLDIAITFFCHPLRSSCVTNVGILTKNYQCVK